MKRHLWHVVYVGNGGDTHCYVTTKKKSISEAAGAVEHIGDKPLNRNRQPSFTHLGQLSNKPKEQDKV